jgi:hypothetical protein
MIAKRPCPQTGVVNYFIAADPMLAVGSITVRTTSHHFDWRCYLDHEIAGTAPDMRAADDALRHAIAIRRHTLTAA